MTSPQLLRREGLIYARHAGRELLIERSHPDPRRPAYWRARDGTAAPLTPWLPSPRIAAIRALRPA